MDDAGKKSALDFIYYELWMLNEDYNFLSNESGGSKRNAFLESFLLHTRNLTDFLEDRKYKSDIKCSDFGINKITINLPIENNVDKINKYLSHMTKDRLTIQKPSWNYSEIKKELDRGIENFINNLPLGIFPTKEGKNKSNFERIVNKK